MVMLVCLRVATGWHFFKEGMSHRFDPNWSSAGFLQQAKGPLAMHYQAVLPKFHDWDRLILAPLVDNGPAAADAGEDAPAAKDGKAPEKSTKPTVYDDWLKQVNSDWKTELESFTAFYNLDSDQQKQAADLQKQSAKQMEELMKGSKGSVGYGDDIRLYRQLAYRAQMMQAVPGGGEIPFIKNRAVVVQKNPVGEAGLSGTAAVISTISHRMEVRRPRDRIALSQAASRRCSPTSSGPAAIFRLTTLSCTKSTERCPGS